MRFFTNMQEHLHRGLPRQFRIALIGVIAFAFAAAPALAQFRASIQGTVSDPTGAAIPGAILMLTDTVNGHTQTATSNATGVYYLNALPADKFKLVVSANGFSTKTLINVTII